MKKTILTVAMVCLFLSVGYSQSNDLKIGDKAPEIKLADIKGDTVSLSSLEIKLY